MIGTWGEQNKAGTFIYFFSPSGLWLVFHEYVLVDELYSAYYLKNLHEYASKKQGND